MPPFVTKQTLAERYNTTPRTIERMWNDGRLPPPKYPTGSRPLADLEEIGGFVTQLGQDGPVACGVSSAAVRRQRAHEPPKMPITKPFFAHSSMCLWIRPMKRGSNACTPPQGHRPLSGSAHASTAQGPSRTTPQRPQNIKQPTLLLPNDSPAAAEHQATNSSAAQDAIKSIVTKKEKQKPPQLA
jgi:hypothetical protein